MRDPGSGPDSGRASARKSKGIGLVGSLGKVFQGLHKSAVQG